MAASGQTLQKGLKQRHLTMIAIGGVIGAGLFVGSGAVIESTGPFAFLTYAVTGVLIIMVMRMLGEMATANPSTGSFSDYSRAALGGWAGFSTAWLYWYFWVVVVGFEAVAGAGILQFWLPDVPLWIMALILMVLMTATNLFSVTSFGEFEYWFASIKVGAIVAFLILGTLYVFGFIGDKGPDFSNLTEHGGAFPLGAIAIFSGIVTVVFSMVGAEIATIAAAESHDPARSIAKATNSVILRIAIFFVGSIFLLTVMIPWNSEQLASPFVSAFALIGVPGIDHLMNAVVLTAVLSCLNSGLYTASRMLFVLAARREAPVALLTVNARGVPVWAILLSSSIGFLCVVAAYVSPERVFSFLLNSSGAVILFVYTLIGISQIVLRNRADDEDLPVKMWGFPVLSYLTVGSMIAVLVAMGWREDTRSQLMLSLLAWGIFLAMYVVTRARGGGMSAADLAVAASPPSRVVLLANETLPADDLAAAVGRLHAGSAEFLVVVPTNPVDTGQAEWEGAAFVWQATRAAAQERVDRLVEILARQGLQARGVLGDYRPWVALDQAVGEFRPEAILVVSHPGEYDSTVHHDTATRARGSYKMPVHSVVGKSPARVRA